MTEDSDSAICREVERHFHETYKTFDAFYDDKKSFFSKCVDPIFRRSMAMRFEKVIEACAPYEGATILDVGCGTGRYCFELALRGVAKTLGIDFAENMIREAIHLSAQQGLDKRCLFIKGSFLDITLDESFDHVIAMGVLDYVEVPVPFVRKMVETAKKTVMISFPSRGGIIQWFRKQLFWRIKKCPVFFYSEQEVRNIVHLAGMKEFTIERMAKDYFLTITITP